MLRASIIFFIIGIIAMIFGAYNIAGMSVEIGKLLLLIFVTLAVVGVIISWLSPRPGS
jgi:uncharacterized membrane protein YtjA (UPF0391 family)